MKVAILGDVHIGCRNNSELFHKHAEKFFSKVFFPTLKKHKIDTVYQLGDLYDVRKSLSTFSQDEARRYLFEPLRKVNIDFHVLLGNHDIYYRELLTVNTPELMLREYKNIHVYNEPTTITVDDCTIDIVPWLCKQNEEEILSFIKNSKSDVCLGHWEIESFAMYRGMVSKGGLSPATFNKYKLCLSGHFHTRSSSGNITYVGTPYEITWQDAGDKRGFHILDTDTLEMEFIENPYTIFNKIEYTSDSVLDDTDLKDKIVRVIVTNKTDEKHYEKFIKSIHDQNPYEVKILEDLSAFRQGEAEIIDLQDTLSIVKNYIDSIDTELNKDEINNYMQSLYVEAINMDEV